MMLDHSLGSVDDLLQQTRSYSVIIGRPTKIKPVQNVLNRKPASEVRAR